MSGLYGSLTQSLSALTAHSRGVETAGRNLANVANPDYARQRVIMGDRGTVPTPQGPQSLGLQAQAIQQMRDRYLDQQVAREKSSEAGLAAQTRSYAMAEAVLGEYIERGGAVDDTGSATLGGGLGELFNAWEAVASRPTDLGERQHLLQRAEFLAERLRLTDQRLGQVQTDINATVEVEVGEFNRLLETLAELNGSIGRMEITTPGAAVDLRDQRQARLEELAEKFGVESRDIPGAPGQLELVVRDTGGTPVILVSRASVNASLSFDGATLSAGGQPLAIAGGHLSGLLLSRDGGVQTLRDQLEAWAAQLATSVNDAYNPGGVPGGDFYTYTPGAVASTLRLAPGVTPATLRTSNGGAVGDNGVALAVVNLAHQAFSLAAGDGIEGTLAQAYAGLVSDFGRTQATVNDRLEDQRVIARLVLQQRDAVSGVSLDEEMADLLKYQRAFQASSRVVSVIDEMLDNIVNRLGRA